MPCFFKKERYTRTRKAFLSIINYIMKLTVFNLITFWLLLLFICSSGYSQGKVVIATSGTTEALQDAVNKASPGDTVVIPEGTFSFSGSIIMDSGLTLLGAGADRTVLLKSGSSAAPLIRVNGSNGLPSAFGGFTMSGIDNDTTRIRDTGIRLDGCLDFHLHDLEMRRFGNAAVYVTGNSRGVIRQSRFIENYRPSIGNLGYGVVVYGEGQAEWSRPLELGTENAVFIEDSYFRANRHAVASNNGSVYVFRYNTVVDNASNFQPVDAHGLEYGSPRGSRSYEIYGNIIDNTAGTSWAGILIRGGDGVIFDNTFLRGTDNPVLLVNRTDGTHNSTSYPAQDQTRSLYAWGNTLSGNPVSITVRPGHEHFFSEGRDYFNYKKPGYEPYTYPHPLGGTD